MAGNVICARQSTNSSRSSTFFIILHIGLPHEISQGSDDQQFYIWPGNNQTFQGDNSSHEKLTLSEIQHTIMTQLPCFLG